VPQDGFLFSDTIENNIAFGPNKKIRRAVREAAKNGCHTQGYRRFPKSYETEIGERGVMLSWRAKTKDLNSQGPHEKAPILYYGRLPERSGRPYEKEIIANLDRQLTGRNFNTYHSPDFQPAQFR
jgi:ATP-binding cassette subfamily B protein